MADLTDAEIDRALDRGNTARLSEPRAATVRYDRAIDRIVVELTNGCTFAFPPCLAQGLENATADQLAEVEILGSGSGLHWEALDADLSVPNLLAGLFGTQAYMARRAGQATSQPRQRRPAPTAPRADVRANRFGPDTLLAIGIRPSLHM